MKQSMINNGLQEGISRKQLKVGVAVLIKWIDCDPEWLLIIEDHYGDKPHNYKGAMYYKGINSIGRAQNFDGQLIIRVSDEKVLFALDALR